MLWCLVGAESWQSHALARRLLIVEVDDAGVGAYSFKCSSYRIELTGDPKALQVQRTYTCEQRICRSITLLPHVPQYFHALFHVSQHSCSHIIPIPSPDCWLDEFCNLYPRCDHRTLYFARHCSRGSKPTRLVMVIWMITQIQCH